MDMLLRCRNATLVRYFGAAFVDQSTLWVVSEYCGLGSVKDYMRNAGKTLSEKQIASICAQVLLGLSYLHSLNIVHRNVKCSNIYVSEKGDIQLGDFGLAECFESLAVKNIDTINQTNYWLAPDADEKSITTKVSPSQRYSFRRH
jgi:serine/threonine protein kinase